MSIDDKYTYPGSGGVLINFGDIRDPIVLDQALNDMASVQWAKIRLEDRPESFDLSHLRSIHQRLFGDLLPFAGKIRDVDAQVVGPGVPYCRPEYIEASADSVFKELRRENNLQGLDHTSFADRIGYYWGEITAIHPFRDGNTRSQSIFISQLADHAGNRIDWTTINVDQLREHRLRAVVASSKPLSAYLAGHLLRAHTEDLTDLDLQDQRERGRHINAVRQRHASYRPPIQNASGRNRPASRAWN